MTEQDAGAIDSSGEEVVEGPLQIGQRVVDPSLVTGMKYLAWVESSRLTFSANHNTTDVPTSPSQPCGVREPLFFDLVAHRDLGTTFRPGGYVRVTVTVLLPASLPVVRTTKSLYEATSPRFSRPTVVTRLIVPSGKLPTTVAVAASKLEPFDFRSWKWSKFGFVEAGQWNSAWSSSGFQPPVSVTPSGVLPGSGYTLGRDVVSG